MRTPPPATDMSRLVPPELSTPVPPLSTCVPLATPPDALRPARPDRRVLRPPPALLTPPPARLRRARRLTRRRELRRADAHRRPDRDPARAIHLGAAAHHHVAGCTPPRHLELAPAGQH